MGLKEVLEHFLARDKETQDFIEGIFTFLDYAASDIVEMDNSSFWKLISQKYSLKLK